MRVLLLGGTGEARALAAALHPDVDVISSLAGRVSNPALPVGQVRIGGFGGADGLVQYLLEDGIGAIVDATHPFAASMSAHAAAASARTGVSLLALRRAGWTEQAGDRWHRVPDIGAAAAALAGIDGTVLLTTGKRDLTAFAADTSHHFVIRVVDPPQVTLPASCTVILDRGPYTLDGERALMREHQVAVLVTKDSGGSMTAAKLRAARELGLPVVMVDRPALPAGVAVVETVEDAARWVRALGSGVG